MPELQINKNGLRDLEQSWFWSIDEGENWTSERDKEDAITAGIMAAHENEQSSFYLGEGTEVNPGRLFNAERFLDDLEGEDSPHDDDWMGYWGIPRDRIKTRELEIAFAQVFDAWQERHNLPKCFSIEDIRVIEVPE